MIVVYVTDYGECVPNRKTTAKAFGQFKDSNWAACYAFANKLDDALNGVVVECPSPGGAVGNWRRYLTTMVWYSDKTPGRYMLIIRDTSTTWRAIRVWGPQPAPGNDWPPQEISAHHLAVPVSYTDEEGGDTVQIGWEPPSTPGDVSGESSSSPWTTVLGAGALAAAGIGGYFLTRWAVNRKS